MNPQTHTTGDDDDVLTADDVAAKLKVSTWAVMAAARRGELPSFYIGRARRFTAADVEAFINAQRAPAAGDPLAASRRSVAARNRHRRTS